MTQTSKTSARIPATRARKTATTEDVFAACTNKAQRAAVHEIFRTTSCALDENKINVAIIFVIEAGAEVESKLGGRGAAAAMVRFNNAIERLFRVTRLSIHGPGPVLAHASAPNVTRNPDAR